MSHRKEQDVSGSLSWRSCGKVVGFALGALLAGGAFAQTNDGNFSVSPSGGASASTENDHLPGGSASQGIRAGKFILYPTLEAIYQYETNLFLTSPGVEHVEASSYVVRPKMLVELPLSRAYLRTSYMAEHRTYDADGYDQPDRWTHMLIFDAKMRAPNGLTVFVQNRHVRSTFYTEEFDPNREVQFGRLPFVKNNTRAEISYRANPQLTMGLFGSFLTVRFDDDDPALTRNFYDFSTCTVGAMGSFRATPLTALFLEIERSVTTRDRAYQDPGLDDDLESTASAVRVGVSGSLTPIMSGRVFIGYKHSEYDNATDSTLTRGEFRGLTFGVSVSGRFSPQTKLMGQLWREENQSSSLGSNYYVTTAGTVTLTHQLSRALFASLGLAYQENHYAAETPTLGVLRDDDIYSIRGGLGFHFNERASVRVNYRYRKCDSTIPVNEYKASVYTVEAQIGW